MRVSSRVEGALVRAKGSIGVFVALALGMASGGHAVAGDAPPADRPAGWLKQPSHRDLLAVWPKEAWKRGQDGKATISCEITTQGALRNCEVVSESPAGAGFGAAALTLSSQFLMKPAIKDGKPVASGVRIPLNFEMQDDGSAAYIKTPSMMDTHHVVTDILWSSAPSYTEVVAAYPAKARQEAKGGRVTLDCVFDAGSHFKRCETLDEEPRGYGFAAAAQVLTKRFEGPPNPVGEGNFTGAHTQIAIAFAPEMLEAKAPVVAKPKWAALPAGREFEQRFAPLARAAGVTSVRVALNCTVMAGGVLGNCTVTGEEPAGAGLGPAALELVPAFRLSIWTVEGLPVIGSSVRAPLRYKLPEAPAPKP